MCVSVCVCAVVRVVMLSAEMVVGDGRIGWGARWSVFVWLWLLLCARESDTPRKSREAVCT